MTGKQKNEEPLTMVLCGRCLSQFFYSGMYYISRCDQNQLIKEDCCYCGCRKGFDYILYPKKKKLRKRGVNPSKGRYKTYGCCSTHD